MKINEAIEKLYHPDGMMITADESGDIAESIDTETAQVSFMIKDMIEKLDAVLGIDNE